MLKFCHFPQTEDVLNHKYVIEDNGKDYQGILLLEDDLTLLTMRKKFLVFNRKTEKVLHKRANMGIWYIHKTFAYYTSREYTITGVIQVKPHTVLIREQDIRDILFICGFYCCFGIICTQVVCLYFLQLQAFTG